MRPKAVIGLGFGDEGKGLVVDYLCEQVLKEGVSPLVTRYSGGPQAGHTVYRGYMQHIFASFGAGTLQNVPTYISRFCVVDPVAVIIESKVLETKIHLLEDETLLYIDERCPVITPYDIAANNEPNCCVNGSCKVGIGATYKREENLYSLTVGDLFNEIILDIKLKQIKQYYLDSLFLALEEYIESIDISKFKNACLQLVASEYINVCRENPIDYENMVLNRKFVNIYEGSQGLLLDQNIGFFPNVTRGNTGSKNIPEIEKHYNNLEYYLVTRAYQTRHGIGPLPNEDTPHNIKVNPKETNVDNERQGKFRRALLDVNLLKYAIYKDYEIRAAVQRTLVITCLDHVEDEYRYTYNGKIVSCINKEEFVLTIANKLGIENVLISDSEYAEGVRAL